MRSDGRFTSSAPAPRVDDDPGSGRPAQAAAKREQAWNDIHDLLPDGWRASAASFDPGTHRWTVACRSPKHSGRLRAPAVLRGDGEDEVAALTHLAVQLRGLRNAERRMRLEAKTRAAYHHGAEEFSRGTLGRPLTQDELDRILERYGGG